MLEICATYRTIRLMAYHSDPPAAHRRARRAAALIIRLDPDARLRHCAGSVAVAGLIRDRMHVACYCPRRLR